MPRTDAMLAPETDRFTGRSSSSRSVQKGVSRLTTERGQYDLSDPCHSGAQARVTPRYGPRHSDVQTPVATRVVPAFVSTGCSSARVSA